jgi:hypothetical protein
VVDVALIGGRLRRLHPALPDPTDDAADLEFVDDTTLRISGGSGYGAPGELIRYTFRPNGSVASIRGESGMRLMPLTEFVLPDRVVAPG